MVQTPFPLKYIPRNLTPHAYVKSSTLNYDASLLGQDPNVRNNQACEAYEYASNWLCSEAILRMRILFFAWKMPKPINNYLQYM